MSAKGILVSWNRRDIIKATGVFAASSVVATQFGSSAWAQDNPIKIGVIDDASGDFAAAVIPKTQGAQLAVDEINSAGGVLGRQLKLLHYDGQSDVKRHQEFAQRAILEDEVNVLMAGYTSSEREAARAVAVQNKTIFWHNNQGEGGIADNYSFFTGPIPEQQILPGVEYMVKNYGKKIYVLAADYGFGQVSAQWVQASAGMSGAEIVGLEFIPLGNSEFSSSIANIQKAKPDFLFLLLVGSNQSQYFPQALAAGLKIPAISSVNLQQGYEHKIFAPPTLENLFVPAPFLEELSDGNPNAKKFVSAIRAKYPDMPYVNECARCAYIAVNLMALAWAKAGTTDTDPVIAALQSGLSFDGPDGMVMLDPATHHLAMEMRMAQVQPDHSIKFVADLGKVEPWWLKRLGVDLTAKVESKQYLPGDDPELAKYLK
jgi:branched-chain amino acid transport system substrate-binding protein